MNVRRVCSVPLFVLFLCLCTVTRVRALTLGSSTCVTFTQNGTPIAKTATCNASGERCYDYSVGELFPVYDTQGIQLSTETFSDLPGLTNFCVSNGQIAMAQNGALYFCSPKTPKTCPPVKQCIADPTCTQSTTPSDNIGVSSQTFAEYNRTIFGKDPATELTTPRGIISRLLPYLFTLGGVVLFVMILWGGFEMLTGAADPKQQEAGKQRITTAVIGFLLLFGSYWLAQIVQAIFGISIL